MPWLVASSALSHCSSPTLIPATRQAQTQKYTFLKGKGDRLTSVIIPLGFGAAAAASLVRLSCRASGARARAHMLATPTQSEQLRISSRASREKSSSLVDQLEMSLQSFDCYPAIHHSCRVVLAPSTCTACTPPAGRGEIPCAQEVQGAISAVIHEIKDCTAIRHRHFLSLTPPRPAPRCAQLYGLSSMYRGVNKLD